jgi:hypothetical protein
MADCAQCGTPLDEPTSSATHGSRTDKHPARYRHRRIHRRPGLTRPRHMTAAPTAARRDVTDEHAARRELVTDGAALRRPDHPIVASAAHQVADCGHAINRRAADLRWGGGDLAVPRAQVADSHSHDLRCPAWTQRRVPRRELPHHVWSTEASVHQATHIEALVQRHHPSRRRRR